MHFTINMAGENEIVAVLEELDDIDYDTIGSGRCITAKPKVLLDSQLVADIKDKLVSNAIMSIELKDALQKISVGELENCLKWLDGCLVKRGLYVAASRERAWKLYHQNLILNVSAMTAVLKSRQAAANMALHTMKELVTLNYSEPNTGQPCMQDISETEEQIIAYISGFLLKKFRYSPEAQALMTSPSKGLVSLMDRGGLTYGNESFIAIIHEFELVFRQMPQRSADLAIFKSAVCEQGIPSRFFPLLESVESSSEKKEIFLIDIMHLFFTVRAYQKCRHLVEKCIQSTRMSRKSKALRDSIL